MDHVLEAARLMPEEKGFADESERLRWRFEERQVQALGGVPAAARAGLVARAAHRSRAQGVAGGGLARQGVGAGSAAGRPGADDLVRHSGRGADHRVLGVHALHRSRRAGADEGGGPPARRAGDRGDGEVPLGVGQPARARCGRFWRRPSRRRRRAARRACSRCSSPRRSRRCTGRCRRRGRRCRGGRRRYRSAEEAPVPRTRPPTGASQAVRRPPTGADAGGAAAADGADPRGEEVGDGRDRGRRAEDRGGDDRAPARPPGVAGAARGEPPRGAGQLGDGTAAEAEGLSWAREFPFIVSVVEWADSPFARSDGRVVDAGLPATRSDRCVEGASLRPTSERLGSDERCRSESTL